jgi:hypothetical protein
MKEADRYVTTTNAEAARLVESLNGLYRDIIAAAMDYSRVCLLTDEQSAEYIHTIGQALNEMSHRLYKSLPDHFRLPTVH